MKHPAILICTLALAALVTFQEHSAAQGTGYRIIVHPDNPTESMTKKEVSQMLLKKRSKWSHGVTVEPVDQSSESSVREAFSEDVHGRSVASIKHHWTKQIFSGRGAPPPLEVDSDAAVLAFVRSRPGAVGYVSPTARLDDVKELTLSDD